MAQAIREKKEWEQSMGVGTMDKMFEAVQGKTPDYNEIDYLSTKPEEHNINYEDLSNKVGIGEIKTASVKPPTIASSILPAYSKAIEKYPSLIEMLGNDDTGDLAEIIAAAMNEWIVIKIGKNSATINKNAIECKEEEGSIKQYYKYDDRVGFVKVAGKFTGDEFVYYLPEENTAQVLLRKQANQYKNVSQDFAVEVRFVETV